MRQSVFFLLVLAFVTFAVGCGNTEAEKLSYGKARDFELKDIKGNDIRLSDYKGKIILLNFFATWCPPCKMEMPDFNEVAKKYAGKVAIIAVAVNDSLPNVERFVDTNNLIFTVAMDDGTASDLYGPIRFIPATFIIDKEFNVAKKYTGPRTEEELIRDIKELLVQVQ